MIQHCFVLVKQVNQAGMSDCLVVSNNTAHNMCITWWKTFNMADCFVDSRSAETLAVGLIHLG